MLFSRLFLVLQVIVVILILVTFITCKPAFRQYNAIPLDQKGTEYWFGNQAEISSYRLTQARYGELRSGEAVILFVTEPFSPHHFTKADQYSRGNIQVLKMNMTKNFITGIYPYSMMTSTFYPMDGSASSLKVSSSNQEWCGHTYMEMKNRGRLEFDTRSYFQGENKKVTIRRCYLEDDTWSKIKLHPMDLPVGQIIMVPAMSYLRLLHVEAKAFTCTAKLEEGSKSNRYTLTYPELKRTLSIDFSLEFPYQILGWEESYPDGFGANKKMLTSTGNLIKTIKSAYWQQNSNAYLHLRDSLGLK